MPDQPTIAREPRAALAGRVATLARLIEVHPAFDLLAEYEAVFLDRHPCAGEAVGCLERAARDLLRRIDATIELLETATPARAAQPIPNGATQPPAPPADQPPNEAATS